VKGYSSGLSGTSDVGKVSKKKKHKQKDTSLVYLRAFAVKKERGGLGLRSNKRGYRQTMKRLRFVQKPFEPTAFKFESLEFFENAALINLGVMSKLSAFYDRKYDRVF
jgi:hypothetical protein